MKAIREEKRIKANWNKAVWFHKRHMCLPIWEAWILYRNTRRVYAAKVMQAKWHHGGCKWKHWKRNVQEKVVDDMVWEMKNTVILFQDWKNNARKQWALRVAVRHSQQTYFKKYLKPLKELHVLLVSNRRKADAVYQARLLPKAFRLFRIYVTQVLAADVLASRHAKRRTCVQLYSVVLDRRELNEQTQDAARLHHKHLYRSLVKHWKMYIEMRRVKHTITRNSVHHHATVRQQRTILVWKSFQLLQNNWKKEIAKADVLRTVLLKKQGYHVFLSHWVATVGQKRVLAAVVVQRYWRGNMDRRLVAGLKVMQQYQVHFLFIFKWNTKNLRI